MAFFFCQKLTFQFSTKDPDQLRTMDLLNNHNVCLATMAIHLMTVTKRVLKSSMGDLLNNWHNLQTQLPAQFEELSKTFQSFDSILLGSGISPGGEIRFF